MLLVGREKAPELRGPVPVWSRGSKTGVGWEDGRDQCEHIYGAQGELMAAKVGHGSNGFQSKSRPPFLYH